MVKSEAQKEEELSVQEKIFQNTLREMTPKVIFTPVIIGINTLVFVVMLINGVDVLSPTIKSLLSWGANFGPSTVDDEWWRLLTCTFLHIGIIHLLFNMWVLWDVGNLVERLVGNVGFVVLYLVSGLIGSLASVFWNPFVVGAGASGAVFGVCGALIAFLAWGSSIPTEVLGKLRNSVLAFLAYNLLFGLGQEGIDMAAHIGGLAAGFICGVAMRQRLTPDSVAKRYIRNVLTVVIGVALIVLAWFIVSEKEMRPPQLEKAAESAVTQIFQKNLPSLSLNCTGVKIEKKGKRSNKNIYNAKATLSNGEKAKIKIEIKGDSIAVTVLEYPY
ncbi:rhomboid family intramembrane serine protease [Thermodesulfobacteriota bacterium]